MREDYCDTCEYLLDDLGNCPECGVSMSKFDPVNKPAHYNMGGIECIDYIKQVLGPEGFVAYCQGNYMKYNHRARYKHATPIEDMRKAEWYLKKALETLEEIHK